LMTSEVLPPRASRICGPRSRLSRHHPIQAVTSKTRAIGETLVGGWRP
jgi:hypothetical protein